MKFKKQYDNLFEGGNAVQNVGPIEQKFVKATLNGIDKEILSKIGLKKQGPDWALLGSIGKKSVASGDIDIAINTHSILKNNPKVTTTEDIIPFIEKIMKKRGGDFTLSKGIGVFSLAFPIIGDKDKAVQLDLMITNNMDFTTWSYWSPRETETKYKKMGFYRNLILSAIASEGEKEVLKDKTIKKTYFDFSKGLGTKIVSFKSKLGKAIKNPLTLSRKITLTVPEEITKKLLGKSATIADTNSFESIFARMSHKDFPFKSKIKNIKKNLKDGFERLGLPVPEEL